MLSRGIGIFGEITLTWAIVPPSSSSFANTEGQVTLKDGQQTAEVIYSYVLQCGIQQNKILPFAC